MARTSLTRRRLGQYGVGGAVALAAAPLPFLGGRTAMADTPPETVVYVSNAGTKDIYVLAMNRTTGEMTLIEKTPVPGTDKPSPASLPMALSPSRRFIYAQLRSPPYPVSSYSIDHTSGRLTHLDETPLVDQMAYLLVDKGGKHLLGASYVGAKVGVYPINALYIVEEKPTQVIDTKPKAHCVFLDAAGKHAYVPVLGGDEILQFKYDAAAGKLTPSDPPAIPTKPGAGPRHLTIHPNGKWAYVTMETVAAVGVYAIDKDKGTLTETGFVETGDYNGKESAFASDLHVTPNGKYLYAAVRKTSLLHGYKIDPDKGSLTAIGKFPTEKTPRGFNIDARGRFLVSVGFDSAGMSVHSIDDKTGELKPAHHYPMGTQPNWVEIVDMIRDAG